MIEHFNVLEKTAWLTSTGISLANIDYNTIIPQIDLPSLVLTHRGPVDLQNWAIFNTILMSSKSWLSQEDLDAGCEHSLVPMDS